MCPWDDQGVLTFAVGAMFNNSSKTATHVVPPCHSERQPENEPRRLKSGCARNKMALDDSSTRSCDFRQRPYHLCATRPSKEEPAVKNDDNHTAAAGAAAAAAASTITICGHDEALRVIFPKLAGNLAQLLLK